MLKRALALLALVMVCAGTSCDHWMGIAVTPGPPRDWNGARDTIFLLAMRVSQQFQLKPYMRPDLQESGFTSCFDQKFPDRGHLILCGKTKGREVHFLLMENSLSNTPHADSLRTALLDSFRGEFGAQAARECEWSYESHPEQSGCPLQTAAR